MTKEETTIDPQPNWDVLNVRTLRASAKEVLDLTPKKRTLKAAYAELYALLKEGERDLAFTCQNCGSLIDDEMEKCWACGLVFKDENDEEEVVDDELAARAQKLGLDVSALERDEAIARIEEEETRRRKEAKDVDLLTIESGKLNEQLTEAMPDGWRKKRSKQYTTYFDGEGTRRIAVYHRGLRVQFSVDDGFLDGFADLQFYTKEERRAKHCGRVNYEYMGDMAKFAFDLAKRVFEKYGS
jgi:RNA polymerase subunit RPABC4/transcription elongation factor Spt4